MEINRGELKRQGIHAAAHLALGHKLRQLFAVCDHQKTISTAKLARLLEDAQEKFKDDAILMRKLADAVPPND